MNKKQKIIPYYNLSSIYKDLVDEQLSIGEKKLTITFKNKKVTAIILDTKESVILVPLIINDELSIDEDFDSHLFSDEDSISSFN